MLKEIIPQFLTTLIVFASIIVISQLVRLSNVLVAFGLTLENVFLPFLYMIVPFLPIMIPISFLFGVVIAFSRLSSDGEFTALLAAGYSYRRAAVPVVLLALLVYAISTTCALHLEAWGRREFVQFIYRKTQTELDNMIRFKIQSGVFLNDFLDYVLYTEEISPDRIHYKNVLVTPQSGTENHFVMTAPRADINGSVAEGELRMVLYDGLSYAYNALTGITTTLRFNKAEIDLLRVFQEKILGEDTKKDDYRSYTASELQEYVHGLKNSLDQGVHDNGDTIKEYWKAAYLLYSRWANSFVALAFALFGLVLGIQDPRQARNRAFISAVVTVISCFVLMVFFRGLAEKGTVPPLAAALIPQGFLGVLAVIFLFRKNR